MLLDNKLIMASEKGTVKIINNFFINIKEKALKIFKKNFSLVKSFLDVNLDHNSVRKSESFNNSYR